MMNDHLIDLLIYSLDNPLSEEEELQLKNALKQSDDLRKEKERLLTIRKQMGQMTISNSEKFVNRVMVRLEKEKIIKIENANIVFLKWFPKIAVACIILILISFLSIYFSEGTITNDALIGLTDVTPDEAYAYLEN